jgi:hypothetical protein
LEKRKPERRSSTKKQGEEVEEKQQKPKPRKERNSKRRTKEEEQIERERAKEKSEEFQRFDAHVNKQRVDERALQSASSESEGQRADGAKEVNQEDESHAGWEHEREVLQARERQMESDQKV